MNHVFKMLFCGATVAGVGYATAASPEDYVDSTSPVQAFADPDTPTGESTLWRTADSVFATFGSRDVPPGHAITLWWVVFNQPKECSPPGCGDDDIFVGGDPAAGLDDASIAAADVVAGFASGTVAADDGTIRLSARLAAGESGTEVIFGDGPLLKTAGLVAEIHLVTRSHGPSIPGVVVEQVSVHDGGCTTLLTPPELADDVGECVDLHFSVHRP
jgi:hypothetical protein